MLTAFTEKIWTCHSDLSVFGVELGTRMTIVDLDGQGTLLVHSPVKLSKDLKEEIDRLGVVNYVVAPNKWHHFFVADFKGFYPKAKFYCAPGLEAKRPDFKFDAVIGSEQTYPWNPSLAHLCVAGIPIFNEVVFFHSETKTLIVTDLAIHICQSRSLLTRTIFKAMGAYGKLGWAKLEKILYVRNRKEFKESVEKILRWDVEKIMLTHGEPVKIGGKERLRKAFL